MTRVVQRPIASSPAQSASFAVLRKMSRASRGMGDVCDQRVKSDLTKTISDIQPDASALKL
jgi:hypothetical protein